MPAPLLSPFAAAAAATASSYLMMAAVHSPASELAKRREAAAEVIAAGLGAKNGTPPHVFLFSSGAVRSSQQPSCINAQSLRSCAGGGH